jgi:hypothetical protein
VNVPIPLLHLRPNVTFLNVLHGSAKYTLPATGLVCVPVMFQIVKAECFSAYF